MNKFFIYFRVVIFKMTNQNRNIKSLTKRKIEMYDANASIIKFWRRNPIIAAEDLFG